MGAAVVGAAVVGAAATVVAAPVVVAVESSSPQAAKMTITTASKATTFFLTMLFTVALPYRILRSSASARLSMSASEKSQLATEIRTQIGH